MPKGNAPSTATYGHLRRLIAQVIRGSLGMPCVVAKGKPSKAEVLEIPMLASETEAKAVAKHMIRPSVNGGRALQGWLKGPAELSLVGLINELSDQAATSTQGNLGRQEATLAVQAHTLDAIFNQLADRARRNIEAGYIEAGETYLKLALRSQSQCRATIESLAVIKYPPNVNFVRQANIANGPQQVNNGNVASHARENQIEPDKLLEQNHGQQLDRGTSTASFASNPPMEAVGAVHRTKNTSGEK
jgi:hypothetical protein